MSPDQAVFVVGDGETLGAWDASRAQRLKRNTVVRPTPGSSGKICTVWELQLELLTGVSVNYKYLIIGRDRRVKWESGKSEFRTMIPAGFETVVVDGAFGRDTDEVWVDEGWLNSENQVRIELGYHDEINGAYTPAVTGPLVESPMGLRESLTMSSSSDNSELVSNDASQPTFPMSLHFFDGISYLSREVVSLPLKNKWTEVVFHMADLNKLKITVEVYDRRQNDPTTRYAGESQTSTDTERLARTCISRDQLKEMRGFCSVPLFNHHLDHVGTLNFKYMIVTPFKHSLNNLASIWKSLSRASKPIGKSVGHRGCGSTRTTFISENTILSFLTAADYGADYVEFDVQVTNEGIPVINHDFHMPVLTSDGVTLNVPVSSLTKKQFKTLRTTATTATLSTVFSKMPSLKRSKSMSTLPNSSRTRDFKANNDSDSSEPVSHEEASGSMEFGKRETSTESSEGTLSKNYSFESLDLNLDHLIPSPSVDDMVGSKVNSGAKSTSPISSSSAPHAVDPIPKSIINPHDRFATLKETLRIVPAEVGFVIEVKYPAERFQRSSKMRYAERNDYADAVLKDVFNAMHNPQLAMRKVMLISFDPDLCVLLSQKQPRFPVFFLLCLNHGIPIGEGDDEIEGYDPRCQTLEMAAKFAARVRLQGLICDASSVLKDPSHFVTTAHEASLLLMTYGAENMQEEMRAIQKNAGVDSLIMDNMVHINRESRQRKQVSSLFLADYGRQHFKLAPTYSPAGSSANLPPP